MLDDVREQLRLESQKREHAESRAKILIEEEKVLNDLDRHLRQLRERWTEVQALKEEAQEEVAKCRCVRK